MTNNWNQIAQQAYETMLQRKHYEELENKLKDRLKDLSGNKTAVGDRFIFLKEERKGNVDYSAVPELKGLDLDKYRKPECYIWRLSEK